jgi:hypothetical protein
VKTKLFVLNAPGQMRQRIRSNGPAIVLAMPHGQRSWRKRSERTGNCGSLKQHAQRQQ